MGTAACTFQYLTLGVINREKGKEIGWASLNVFFFLKNSMVGKRKQKISVSQISQIFMNTVFYEDSNFSEEAWSRSASLKVTTKTTHNFFSIVGKIVQLMPHYVLFKGKRCFWISNYLLIVRSCAKSYHAVMCQKLCGVPRRAAKKEQPVHWLDTVIKKPKVWNCW